MYLFGWVSKTPLPPHSCVFPAIVRSRVTEVHERCAILVDVGAEYKPERCVRLSAVQLLA